MLQLVFTSKHLSDCGKVFGMAGQAGFSFRISETAELLGSADLLRDYFQAQKCLKFSHPVSIGFFR